MKRAGNESRRDGSPMEGSARENAGNCRRGRANLPSACEEGGQKAAHAGERSVDTAENRARPGSIADSGEASADSGDAFAGRVDAARRDVSVGREDAAWRDAARAGTSLAPSNVQAGIGAGQGELGLRPEPSAGEGAAGSIADSGEVSVDSGVAPTGRVDAARWEDASVGCEDAARRDMPHDVMSFAPFAVQACARAGGGDAGLRPEPSTGEEDTGSTTAALESGAQMQRTDSSERSDDALREKLLRAHAGDAQAREELISENLALVRFLVKPVSSSCLLYTSRCV